LTEATQLGRILSTKLPRLRNASGDFHGNSQSQID